MREDNHATSNGAGVDCSVLVPVLNEEQYILDSIRAMQSQRFDGRVEFLLADGGSTDRTRELLEEIAREDPRIKVLDNPRAGTPSGLNVALAHATGRWVARMDAHTRYAEDYLALGVARLLGGGTRWVSGPPIATGNGPVSRAVALALRSPLGRGASRKWAAEQDGQPGEYELDSGVFAGVWERKTLLEYGGWDEDWLRNQDSEMAGRFLRAGERLVCIPAMAARYTPRGSLTGLWRQYLQYGQYREKTAVRHPHTMRRSHLFAPLLVLNAVASVTAPGRMRRLAQRALGLYLLLVVGGSLPVMRHAEAPGEAALVPVVIVIMHLAHGAGAIGAAFRYGPPLAGIALALGIERVARNSDRGTEPVFAPSLRPRQGTAR